MGKFANKGVAKLGIRIVPGSTTTFTNQLLPAIPNTHSILIELFFNFNSPYIALGSNPCWVLYNSAYNESMHYYCNNTAKKSVLRLGSVAGGSDLTSGIVYPIYPRKYYYIAMLLDRTNSKKKIYEYGNNVLNDAIAAVNPNFNTANNIFYATSAGVTVVDFTYIALRFSTLSSVPSDIDAAIKRMWNKPMLLDSSLSAVAVIASQWDFSTDTYSTTSLLTLLDTGIVGGYNLTSNIDCRPLLTICEKI